MEHSLEAGPVEVLGLEEGQGPGSGVDLSAWSPAPDLGGWESSPGSTGPGSGDRCLGRDDSSGQGLGMMCLYRLDRDTIVFISPRC